LSSFRARFPDTPVHFDSLPGGRYIRKIRSRIALRILFTGLAQSACVLLILFHSCII
jgi:hypothetical protein